MSQSLKILIVAGARPNFMKVAPLMKCIARRNASAPSGSPRLTPVLVHTGQHYDHKMSEIFFQELGIPAPDINLGVGSGSHAVQTAQVMTGFEGVCLEQRPDWVVVVGDVNSTIACTLVCAKLGIRVAHVEAGLRSYDRAMPEEINRLVTDALADLLLTPSEDANDNLRREGVAESRIRLVGNIMIDSLVDNLDQARRSKILESHSVQRDAYIYVTLHRPSNVDHRESLAAIMAALERLSHDYPVLFPMHPRTRKMLEDSGMGVRATDSLKIIEPVGYHDSLCLTEHARLVLTDSGGLQEESTYFRTPCLTLRPNTERPVTVTLGSNKLTTIGSLTQDLHDVFRRPRRIGEVPSLWDGRTADRVLDALVLCGR